jgi:hypothetical protein
MPNIVGEYFNEIITKQVDQRQKIYGSINRDNNQLNYLNNRTGWCKLVSSVDIDEDATIRKFNLTKGSDLAKNCILFAGLSYSTDNSNKTPLGYRYGVAEQDSVFNNTAYGFGGLEFGLRPMPGIISAEIKTETRGSIKKATVKLQANNRTQFDIIDLLYMRLGYSMLLEWGNSSYFDNDGKYIEENPYSMQNEWFSGYFDDDNNPETAAVALDYSNILDVIRKRRLDSCGNYDAIFAKVFNFSWTFTEDGKYNITINLISLGDVIESLKANNLLGNPSSLTPSEQQAKLEADAAALKEEQRQKAIEEDEIEIGYISL